ALIQKVVMTAKLAKTYNVPTVLATVNGKSERNKDTSPDLKKALGDIPSIDRSSIHAWHDKEFVQADKAPGRKNLVIAALW
ncbi:hydrolase, partial [Lactobacillus paracasei]|nr:hydrolase [Lacticaseibacillus paracasei]